MSEEIISRLYGNMSEEERMQAEYEEAKAKQRFDQINRERAAYQEGLEEGIKQAVWHKVISRLLQSNMSIEQICKITDFSKEKILEIQSKIKS